jgi:hypothetical protein
MTKRNDKPRKGRDWFGVETNRVLGLDWIAAPRALLGHWLVLFAYGASQGERGRIRRVDENRPKGFPHLRIGPGVLEALIRYGFIHRRGSWLEVVGYDHERDSKFGARVEGARSAANKRWKPNGDSSTRCDDDARGNARGNAAGIPDQTRQEERSDPPKAPHGGHDGGGSDPEGFPAFWAALPLFLQQRRLDAVREWQKLGLDHDQVAQQRIQKALERQGSSTTWLEDNRKHHLTPKMYLRGRRWEDGPDPQAERRAGPSKNGARAVEASETPEERESKFRAQWEADAVNAGKTFPGMANVIAAMSRDLSKAIAARGNTQ